MEKLFNRSGHLILLILTENIRLDKILSNEEKLHDLSCDSENVLKWQHNNRKFFNLA